MTRKILLYLLFLSFHVVIFPKHEKWSWISSARVATLLIGWAEHLNASLLADEGEEYKDFFQNGIEAKLPQADIQV